ncbi:hypothetical protein AX14_013871 [Amanita brunnescens Koide BX004]|nr:hypothetical protein AX14_013871 [Amanita brunnescens Koide BX004]
MSEYVQMLAFIKSQPSVVENLLRHVEVPPFVDLLTRIIQLDELPEGAGTLEWLSSQNFMQRLVDLLAPRHTTDVHTIVSELIKNIISMATPSPAVGITEGLQNGLASNRFARQLAQRESISKLIEYILYDFGPGHNVASDDDEPGPTEDPEDPNATRLPTLESATSSVVQSISIIIELIRKNNSDYFEPYLFHTLRNRLIQIQQHLHTQTEDGREDLERAMQEMVDRMGVVHFGPLLDIMCEKMGELQRLLRSPRSLTGPVSTTIGQITPLTLERYRICELFAELLHCSNMSVLNRPPEYDYLYDEKGRLRGGLAALEGLAQVISLNQMAEREREPMEPIQDEVEPSLELPVHGASRSSPVFSSDDDMSSDDEPGSSDEDAMEEIAMFDEPQSMSPAQEPSPLPPSSSSSSTSPPENPFSPPPDKTPSGTALSRTVSRSQDVSPSQSKLHGSRRSSRRTLSGIPSLFIGEKLKKCFVDMNVLSTFLDFFFEFPWNNFLHSAVYDFIHQILTGNINSGLNRELAIALFRDARIMNRIVQGQKLNDIESSKPKGVRLGYMGHLTLIAEDVLVTLERYPPDLREILIRYAPVPEWEEYVSGRYSETKERDTNLLGGGKPAVTGTTQRGFSKWHVDEDDSDVFTAAVPAADIGGGGLGGGAIGAVAGASRASGSVPEFGSTGNTNTASTLGLSTENGVKAEFNKQLGGHPPRATTADFGLLPGPARCGDIPEEKEDEGGRSAPRFASYLAQEIHSSEVSCSGGSSSSDEEDEDGGGWLSQSTFELGPAASQSTLSGTTIRHSVGMSPPSGVERRPLSSVDARFDDAFDPLNIGNTSFAGARGFVRPVPGASASGGHVRNHAHGSPFGIDDDDDDGFSPFSDTHAAAVQGDDVSFGGDLRVHHLGTDVGTAVAVGGVDGEDPFGCSSFSDDGDSSFDAFGDFGEFQSADADCFGGYDGDGQEDHDHGHRSGNRSWNRLGVHVEVVGRGGSLGVNGAGEGEFALTPTATTGSWTFAGSEDGSPNPSPGLNLSAVHDEDE